jgi:sulfonate transport system ATP-binding protein
MTALFDVAIASKRHGARQVLHDVHLTVDAGAIVSLVGASGCGKSTLLAIAAGLDRSYRGLVQLAGAPVHGPVDGIGMVFQEPRLFPWLTAAQNIAFGGVADAALVAALLDDVGLTGFGAALPHQLSGGQAQRVAMARGLYTQPRVLLLDEPFSAVDAFTRMQLQDVLLRVAAARGLTVLLVTHDIDEALHLSDRVDLLGAAGLESFDVPLPRPRVRGDGAGYAIKRALLERLQASHTF